MLDRFLELNQHVRKNVDVNRKKFFERIIFFIYFYSGWEKAIVNFNNDSNLLRILAEYFFYNLNLI